MKTSKIYVELDKVRCTLIDVLQSNLRSNKVIRKMIKKVDNIQAKMEYKVSS